MMDILQNICLVVLGCWVSWLVRRVQQLRADVHPIYDTERYSAKFPLWIPDDGPQNRREGKSLRSTEERQA